jgi:UDP-2,4-diacetamido-2,4,6-trideoxy-beta-L-altropyranose hydrolase
VSVLVVRADANAAIGLGHAMRCLALAQAHRDAGGRAVFAMAEPPAPFAARLADEGCAVRRLESAEETVALAREAGAAWLVLDGYQFDAAYERALVGAGPRLLVLDDHDSDHHADLILRQGLGAAGGERVLAGPRYALLRREFRTWGAPSRPVADQARRVLVTLGGGDPGALALRVLAALERVDMPLEVQWLTGPLNPRRAELEQAAPDWVQVVVDAADMPQRMAWADLAVTAAGITSWELARVGTPQIAIELAYNQRAVARALADAGIAVRVGWHEDVDDGDLAATIAGLARDAGAREEMARRGRATIDGQGAVRVLEAMGLATTMPPDGDPVRTTVARRR